MSQCGPAKVHRNVLAFLYFLKFPSLLVTILPGEKSVVFSVLFLFFFEYNKTSNVKNVPSGLGLQGKLFYCLMCKWGMQELAVLLTLL